jgi:hypothetical protein
MAKRFTVNKYGHGTTGCARGTLLSSNTVTAPVASNADRYLLYELVA